jgi:hypothetical protein
VFNVQISALHDLDLFGWDVKHSAYSNPYNNSYFPLCYYNNIEPLGSSLSQVIHKGYPVVQEIDLEHLLQILLLKMLNTAYFDI